VKFQFPHKKCMEHFPRKTRRDWIALKVCALPEIAWYEA
jgi:hypothetical protein